MHLDDLRKSHVSKGSLEVVRLDVSDLDSIRALPAQLEASVSERDLDYLINNAGILEPDTAFTIDPEAMERTLRSNVVGPAFVSRLCLPLLEKGIKKTILKSRASLGASPVSAASADLRLRIR
ncbi:hypothetical protein BV20DRAFT_31685 [Pilatotrama ljubarskyi]|nr:hypothetical protein BV20DRAFT_31685 [Pilatotrama ljubarskyi]